MTTWNQIESATIPAMIGVLNRNGSPVLYVDGPDHDYREFADLRAALEYEISYRVEDLKFRLG